MKRSTKAKIAAGAISGILMLFSFWCGGYDFDKRGETAVFVILFTVFAICISATCPAFDDLDK